MYSIIQDSIVRAIADSIGDARTIVAQLRRLSPHSLFEIV